MISIPQQEGILKALKTSEGCQRLKAHLQDLYRLSMKEVPPGKDTIEEIVTIAESALFELGVVRKIEERHNI